MISERCHCEKRISAAGDLGGYLLPLLFLNRAALFVVLLLSGCSQLPDYALPQLYEDAGPGLPGIPYGKLVRNDFQAESLPAGMEMHAGSLSARSSLQIRPVQEVKIAVHSDWYNEKIVYFGHVENLRFEAVFIPEKSWWNPEMPKDKEAYVLEHEQIHFGLLELNARRLTEETAAAGNDLFVIDTSFVGAREAVIKGIQELIRSGTIAQFEEHRRFDEETSLFYDPPAQRRWLERVEEQLGE